MMLFTLARHEVAQAEAAAQEQQAYRSPARWSLQRLAWVTFRPDYEGGPGPHWRGYLSGMLVQFNPSRAILGLETRGFVLRNRDYRHRNLVLTKAGFAEARRLGGVPDSEIVDLDRVAENWQDHVWLGPDPVLSENQVRGVLGLPPIDRRKEAGKKSAELRAWWRQHPDNPRNAPEGDVE